MVLLPPDFAIVGAPKCGTTALFSYLASHPGVSMSARKEPFFWCPDIKRSGQVTDPGAYHALWADAPPGTLRGEASPEYLRSRVAIPQLLAARPDVRLVAMIRNPVDLIASLHANLLLSFQEDARDFEIAWKLQAPRREGRFLPARCTEPCLLQYADYAAIGDQLERFHAAVPASQRLVILLDDFRADPRAEYRRVLELLGLSEDGRMDFSPVHANRVIRSRWLATLPRSLAHRLGPLAEPARAAAHALGIKPAALVSRFNIRTAPRKPLRPEFEAELLAACQPQVEKVARLLGRDLSAWKAPRTPVSAAA